MLMKLISRLGQPVCLALYGLFGWQAANKKPVPLILLVLLHLTEYFAIGKKTGSENRVSPVKAFFLCLAFGFTWWLPVKNKNK